MRQRPSASRRQTVGTVFVPVGRPSPSAQSPSFRVLPSLRSRLRRWSESATISIEEMTTAGARRGEARPDPRPPAFRVRRRSHPPCSSQPRPSGLKPRTLRREPSPRFESRRRRTKRVYAGGHYVPARCECPHPVSTDVTAGCASVRECHLVQGADRRSSSSDPHRLTPTRNDPQSRSIFLPEGMSTYQPAPKSFRPSPFVCPRRASPEKR